MKNKKEKINLRKFLFMLPLLLLTLTTTVVVTFAWWNMLTKTQEATVLLGEGVAVTVDVDLTQDKVLVPTGHLVNSDTQTERVTLTYNVGFDGVVTETFTLSVVASGVMIDGDVTYADLVNIVITAPPTVDNTGGTVTVEVTLDEPADEATYIAVAGKHITFTLTFTTALAQTAQG